MRARNPIHSGRRSRACVLGGTMLVLVVPVAMAAGTPSKPGLLRFQTASRVAVDAGGQITAVEPPASLPAPITSALEARIRRLRFEAPVIDGRAVPGETWVQMEVCAAPVGDAYRLAMKFRGNGPSLASEKPLQYPFPALRARASAKYEIVFAILPDGSARLESAAALSGGKGFAREFQQSLADWAGSMRFHPEFVAGKPVGTRVTRKVEYIADGDTLSQGAFRRKLRKRGEEDQQSAAASETCEAAIATGDRDETRQVAIDTPIHVSDAN